MTFFDQITDFDWFVGACIICLVALLYAAAMGDDDPPNMLDSSFDL